MTAMTREDVLLLLQNQLAIMLWLRSIRIAQTSVDEQIIEAQMIATEKRIQLLQNQMRRLGGIVPQHEEFIRHFGEIPM